MQATFEIDEQRARQLLSFEPGYRKDPYTVDTDELLQDFTAAFLSRNGMVLISPKKSAEPAPAKEAPVQAPAMPAAAEPAPHKSEALASELKEKPAPGVSASSDEERIMLGLCRFEKDRRLKVNIGAFDMIMTVSYPGGVFEAVLTQDEYDLYYNEKKKGRFSTEPGAGIVAAATALYDTIEAVETRTNDPKICAEADKLRHAAAEADI